MANFLTFAIANVYWTDFWVGGNNVGIIGVDILKEAVYNVYN